MMRAYCSLFISCEIWFLCSGKKWNIENMKKSIEFNGCSAAEFRWMKRNATRIKHSFHALTFFIRYGKNHIKLQSKLSHSWIIFHWFFITFLLTMFAEKWKSRNNWNEQPKIIPQLQFVHHINIHVLRAWQG